MQGVQIKLVLKFKIDIGHEQMQNLDKNETIHTILYKIK